MFIGILAIVFGILDRTFESVFKKDIYYKSSWLLNKKGESYDVGFLGNSRIFTQLYTDSLSKKLHQSCINLGVDGTNILHHYLLLQHFLQHNKLNHLVYNIDPWSLSFKLDDPKRTWVLMNNLDDETIYNEYRNTFGYKAWAWKYVPFWRYAEYNARLGIISVGNSQFHLLTPEYNTQTGDYIKDNKNTIDLHKKNRFTELSDSFKVNEQNIYFLKKLIALCRSKGVKLSFITAPILNTAPHIRTKIHYIQSKYLQPILDQEKIDYIDFTNIELTKDFRNFYDDHHLNYLGKKKYNTILAEELLKSIGNHP